LVYLIKKVDLSPEGLVRPADVGWEVINAWTTPGGDKRVTVSS